MIKRKMLPLVLSVILGLQGMAFAAEPEAVYEGVIEESALDQGIADEASAEMNDGEIFLGELSEGELLPLEETPVFSEGDEVMTEDIGSLLEEEFSDPEEIPSDDDLLEDGTGETGASVEELASLEEAEPEEVNPEEAAPDEEIQEEASGDPIDPVGELLDDDPASPEDEAYTRDKAVMALRANGSDFITLEKVGRKYSYAFQVLRIVNQERAKEGLSPLKMNAELLQTAMLRAAECSIYFSHTRPDGSPCFSACSAMWGENIASGYGSPASVMNGWMNSAGHRSNILGESYSTIGIGCVMRNGSLYWVQCFGTGSDTADCAKPSDRYVNQEIEVAGSLTEDDGYGGISKTNFSLFCVIPDSVVAGEDNAIRANLMKNMDGYTTSIPILASALTITSSNPSVLTVGSGSIKGVKAGTVNVTVSGRNGTFKQTQKVTVVAPPKQPKLVAAYNGVNGIGIKFYAVNDATEYVIYRKYKGVWSEIRTISASSSELQRNGSALMYTDTSVKYNYGEGYIYSVAAKRGSLVSTYDTKGSAIYRLNPPQNPTGVKAGDGKAKISWGRVPCLGYEVQYYETGLGTQNWVKCPQTASLAQTISGLKKGKGYGFRIRCYKTNKDRGTYYSEYTRTFYVKV